MMSTENHDMTLQQPPCLTLPDASACVNCGACRAICPQDVLGTITDGAGFSYVQVRNREACISCGLCIKVCPMLQADLPTPPPHTLPTACAAWHRQPDIVRQSTSGGAFTGLAQAALQQGWLVAGVCLEHGDTAYHLASTLAELAPMRGSKYLPSSIGQLLPQLAKAIRQGKRFLVTGTPCQLVALRRYLEAARLPNAHVVTCEVICAGTPSPAFLRRECAQYGIRLLSFRDKSRSWESSHALFGLNEQTGQPFRLPLKRSPFYSGFTDALLLRQACHHCPFARLPRQADLTMGDFWHPRRFSERRHEGMSIVLANSDNGAALLQEAQAHLCLHPISLAEATAGNPRLYNGLQPHGDHPLKRLLPFACQHFPWPLLKLLYGGTYRRPLVGKLPFELLYPSKDKRRILSLRAQQLSMLRNNPDFSNSHAPIRHLGILTFHRPLNFGAVLQAYALQNTLAQLNPGADIAILDLVPPFLNIPPAPWHKFRKRAQQRAFLTFLNRHLPLSANQSSHLADLTDGLDTIVVGSDQVWNPDITKDAWKNYFLDGIPDSIRACSYAASFGEGTERAFAPDIQDAMATLLKRFDRISVREESGLDICRQLGRPDAIHVLDPVLAADPYIYDALLAEASDIQPAITAILLDETAAQRRLLTHLGKQARLPARIIAIRQRRLPTPGIQRPFATSIPDYLASIRNAPLVVTDSFHAVMFSLVFQRPFIATPSTKNKRFDRIANILTLLGLQDRIAQQQELDKAAELLRTPIDYQAIQPQLQQLRSRSREFIASI